MRYSSLQRSVKKNKPMGIDIPGRDQPVGKSFIERVSEETMREFEQERNQYMEKRKKQSFNNKLFPALTEATQMFHSREGSVQRDTQGHSVFGGSDSEMRYQMPYLQEAPSVTKLPEIENRNHHHLHHQAHHESIE